jgi:uncharacterized protein (TIGR02145 family)
MSGGTTTAMTYTWTVGGTPYTTTSNTYTTVSLSSSAAYTLKVTNANNCVSATASGNITVTSPATNGQTANSCGCASGTINCSGTCRTDQNYTTNDGACTSCNSNYAYTQLRNACGTVINSRYNTFYTSSCSNPDYTSNDGACTGNCGTAYVQLRDGCSGSVKNARYSTYTNNTCTAGCCPYTGSDLITNSSYLCQQRTSGAKNWQAYIIDSRDNEVYRIVLMPDNKWWLAQNVKYAKTGTQPSWCTKDQCGRYYSHAQVRGSSGSGSNRQGICPPGWVLPLKSHYETLTAAMSSTTSVWLAMMTSLDSRCTINDHYGWAAQKAINNYGGANSAAWEFLFCNDANGTVLITNDINGATSFDCGHFFWSGSQNWDIVRCYRP